MLEAKRQRLFSRTVFRGSRLGMTRFSNNTRAVKGSNLIEYSKLKLLLESNFRLHYKISMIENEYKWELFSSIDIKKFEVLMNMKSKISGYMLEIFLLNKEAIDAFNSLDYEKFTLLATHGACHDYDRFLRVASELDDVSCAETDTNLHAAKILQCELEQLYRYSLHNPIYLDTDYNLIDIDFFVEDLLKLEHMVEALNSVDTEKFKVLFTNENTACCIIAWLFQNKNAPDALNSIDIKKLELLLDSSKLYNEYIMNEILQNSNSVVGVNTLDIKRIKLLLKKSKFDGISLGTLLSCTHFVETVNSIDIGRLKILLESGKLNMEINRRENPEPALGIQIIMNDDKYHYKASRVLPHFKDCLKYLVARMNSDKLTLLVESDIFDLSLMMELSTQTSIIRVINSMDINSLKLMLDISKYKNVVINSRSRTVTSMEQNVFPNEHGKMFADKAGKNYVIEMCFNYRSIAAIRFLGFEKFKFLVKCKYISGVTLKEMLKDVVLCNQLKHNDVKVLKLMFNKLPVSCVLQMVKHQPYVQAIVSIGCRKLSALLDGERFNRVFILNLLKIKKVVDFITSIESNVFTSLLRTDKLYEFIIKKLFRAEDDELFIIENAELLKKLELFLNCEKHSEKTINYILAAPDAMDNLDLISIERLKLILYDNKLNTRSVKCILENNIALAKINKMNIRKLRQVCHLPVSWVMLEILRSHKALDGISYMDHQRIKMLLSYDFKYEDNGLPKLLQTQELVSTLNSMNLERFKSLVKSGNLYSCLFIDLFRLRIKDTFFIHDLLRNKCIHDPGLRKVFDEYGINCIDNLLFFFDECPEKNIIDMLDKQRLLLEFIVRVDQSKFRILFNTYNIFDFSMAYPEFVDFLNGLSNPKLKMVTRNGALPVRLLLEYHEMSNHSAFLIECIQTEKLSCLTEKDELKHVLRNRITVNVINKLDVEKVNILCSRKDMIAELLENRTISDVVTSFEIERFRLLAMSNENNTGNDTFSTLKKILQNNDICRLIHSMDIERLNVLVNGVNVIQLLNLIPEYQSALDFIKFTSIENLRNAISMIEFNELVSICQCYEGDVKRNLKFAIVLFKYNNISTIDLDFLCNNEAVYSAVCEVFPEGFHVDQMLLRSKADGGIISSLRDMSMVAWMDQSATEADGFMEQIIERIEYFSMYLANRNHF